jgi:xanthine dehydrogenase accessory factor
VGAKALFYADGCIKGTLGGGCLEAEVQRLALQSLRDGRPRPFDFVLDHDFGWDDGLICGGKVLGVILPNAQNAGEDFWTELAARRTPITWGVRVDFTIAPVGPAVQRCGGSTGPAWYYREIVTPPCALWIAGSGHIAQAVAPLARQLDFAVTIFDDRPELANPRFFPSDVTIRTGNWGALCDLPLPEVPAFGLIVTRGHKHDALVLETWIHRPFVFLGLIGSTRQARVISQRFIEKNLATPEEIQRVACPVGLRIRAQSVMEIAVSILAQFVEKRAERACGQSAAPKAQSELV